MFKISRQTFLVQWLSIVLFLCSIFRYGTCASVNNIANLQPSTREPRAYTEIWRVANECPEGLTGYKCKKRTCPLGIAHKFSPYGSSQDAIYTPFSEFDPNVFGGSGHHSYTECSSAGTCDHRVGECECQPGYTGAACQRQECPNLCSGHGTCSTSSAAHGSMFQSTDLLQAFWDFEKIQQCQCDPGWIGADCSKRSCPQGIDPTCAEDTYDDVQAIDVTALDSNDYFVLEFLSLDGNRFQTYPVHKTDPGPVLQSALEALPSMVIPSVQVSKSVTALPPSYIFYVTFSDPTTAGKQSTLVCNPNSYSDTLACENGVIPKLERTAGKTCTVTHVSGPETQSTLKYTTSSECSSRGICDRETGICKCFEGAAGYTCAENVLNV